MVGYIEEEDDLTDDSDDDTKGPHTDTTATSVAGDESSGRSFERRFRQLSHSQSGSDSERSGGGREKRLSFSYKSARMGGVGRRQSTRFGRLASFGGSSGDHDADARRASFSTDGGSDSASADERRKSFGNSTDSVGGDTRRTSFGGRGGGTLAVGPGVKLSAEAAAIVNGPSPPQPSGFSTPPPNIPKNASAPPGGMTAPVSTVEGGGQGKKRSSPKRSLSFMAERPVELGEPLSGRISDRQEASFAAFWCCCFWIYSCRACGT